MAQSATIPSRFHNAPVSQTIGFEVSNNSSDEVEVTMEVGGQFWNPMGKLQGGILAVIADAAMGIAFGRELSEDCPFSTVDFHIHYMRPVTKGWVCATARLVQRGLSMGFLECEVHAYSTEEQFAARGGFGDNDSEQTGKLVARASCSCTSG